MAELPWTMTEPTQDDWGGWICRAEERDDDGDTSPICGTGRTAEDARRNCELAVDRVNAHEELCAALRGCVDELGDEAGAYAARAIERARDALDLLSGQPMKGSAILQAAAFLFSVVRHLATVHELYKDSSPEERLQQYELAAKKCQGALALAMGDE